jgi:hypothetical protein
MDGIVLIVCLIAFAVGLPIYRFGRFVEKRWPTRHLRPWLWHVRRNS